MRSAVLELKDNTSIGCNDLIASSYAAGQNPLVKELLAIIIQRPIMAAEYQILSR